ncbi:acyl-homoserine-lactone synthase [Octadecabacter sp. 1_MG-2023]|uniref:acyl-homoserine-lactone synthase n=1 Tax=unclassified Octadecabacter TaxID=196158 RepID=UPI001C0A3316|nr:MULTISPECIES: acyl-homoserine-lactone synthase [unclassified Octadecabacter]MBU2993737.1 autoinducer synthase [Octadecabacter sp. B2R22]MDO6735418.1 acyl-homoserine-lactone synthase [Octadecabacter sp. 1_MG-2023]
MKNVTFELSNVHQYGSSFFDYLALRKQFFVDALHWQIPHNAEVEMDQYDNPMARYSLVLDDNGRVLAGARAMSTAAVWGDHTYMLKDAMTGKLDTIPSDLLTDVIDSPKVWECTRLVIAPEVNSMRMRTQCLDLIVEGLIEMANKEGADTLISLSNLWLLRALKRLGYGAELLGEPYENGDDGHKYAVMAIAARHKQVANNVLQMTAA